MPRAFADITFTPSVKAAQLRYGSRSANEKFEHNDEPMNTLTPREVAFIHACDGCYQATVSETGWPYVQFRGGPAGFLQVLDAQTLGYADFRGNRQYMSVGNINADGRIALILMDYPNRRRLKIWGRAKVVHATEDSALVVRLKLPDYHAHVERAVIISIDAYDWNCPQHITPRYTEKEITQWAAPLLQQLADLEQENARLKLGVKK